MAAAYVVTQPVNVVARGGTADRHQGARQTHGRYLQKNQLAEARQNMQFIK